MTAPNLFGRLVDTQMSALRTSCKKLEKAVGASHTTISTWVETNRWPEAVIPDVCRALRLDLVAVEGQDVVVRADGRVERYGVAGWIAPRLSRVRTARGKPPGGNEPADPIPGGSPIPGAVGTGGATTPATSPAGVADQTTRAGSPTIAEILSDFRGGRFGEAYRALVPLAEAGDAVAQNHLGWMFQHGLGVVQDHAEAARWYGRAAGSGDHCGQSNLAWMYEHGLGVAQDVTAAVRWHRLAAAQGNGLSMNQLGWMAQHGLGVEQDLAAAARWYQSSADAGNPSGLNNLGWVYEHGLGVNRDLQRALGLYVKAVERGNSDARSNLARLTVPPASPPLHEA